MPGPARAGGSGLLLLKPATTQALWTHTHPLPLLCRQESSSKHLSLETDTPYLRSPVLEGLRQLVPGDGDCGLCLALSGQSFLPVTDLPPFLSGPCPTWWERKHRGSWLAVFLEVLPGVPVRAELGEGTPLRAAHS